MTSGAHHNVRMSDIKPDRVEICDVGPRDGLQNEARSLAPDGARELCDRLAGAGLHADRGGELRQPKRVPQMAGAEEVVAGVRDTRRRRLAGLVLNERGYERALATGLREVHYAFPVTDTFAERNQGVTVAEAIAAGGRIVERARADGLRVTSRSARRSAARSRGGSTRPRSSSSRAGGARVGPDEILLADTIGTGVPTQVAELVGGVAALGATVGCHFHNTRNTGYANALAAVEAASRCWTRPSAAPAGARSRPGRPGTSRPRTSSTCCRGWGSRPASSSPRCWRPRSGSRRARQGAAGPHVQGGRLPRGRAEGARATGQATRARS